MTAHLDRACELLWHAGHPAIAEALQVEVGALEADRAESDAELSLAVVRAEAAEKERDSCEEDRQEMFVALAASEAREKALRGALTDFAEHGTRFDCNPTVRVFHTPEWVSSQEWWQNRATEMDVAVRNRARAALAASSPEGETT